LVYYVVNIKENCSLCTHGFLSHTQNWHKNIQRQLTIVLETF